MTNPAKPQPPANGAPAEATCKCGHRRSEHRTLSTMCLGVVGPGAICQCMKFEPAAPKPRSEPKVCASCDGAGEVDSGELRWKEPLMKNCIACQGTGKAQPATPPEPPQIPDGDEPDYKKASEIAWNLLRKAGDERVRLESALATERVQRKAAETARREAERRGLERALTICTSRQPGLVYERMPTRAECAASIVRVLAQPPQQTAKLGVSAFFGTWPGEETDAELLDGLDEVRGKTAKQEERP